MLKSDTYYHVYNHADGSDNLFREEKNFFFFMEKCRQHINPVAETPAWCLMPNHFHLPVKIKSDKVPEADSTMTFPKFETLEKFETVGSARSKLISKRFTNFFSSYTQCFSKVYNRKGSLFIKNFRRKVVTDEEYLRNLILYIHLNPVKHGFTAMPGDWKHSSFEVFPQLQPQRLRQLFDDETNYRFFTSC